MYQQAIARALGGDTTGTPGRLVRTSLSAWGALQIEFVLRDQGSPPASRAAALDDLLRIARAVYQGPPPRPVTVLGLAGRGMPGASAGRWADAQPASLIANGQYS